MEGAPAPSEKCRVALKSGKARVKSGCRTCKIRKVKCDESRPSCDRCTSTGRKCDGYLLPASSTTVARSACVQKPANGPQYPALRNGTVASAEEMRYFEWFRCRSYKKVQGIFALRFWDTLVFQASMKEPAVLHATLALSSAQKTPPTHGSNLTMTLKDPEASREEIFTLQQYVKAISHLDPHFSAQNKASLRVALITCLLFICLDFFRGHSQTAQVHLHNGLKLLEDIRGESNAAAAYLVTSLSGEPIDDWLSAALFRLYVQVGLFNVGYGKQNTIFHRLRPEPLPSKFCTIAKARLHLDQLTHRIIRLTEYSREQDDSADSKRKVELHDHQKKVLSDLSSWFSAYVTSKVGILAEFPVRNEFAYRILYMYYFMVKIMAHACIWPTHESLYDSHTESFTSLLSWAISLRKSSRSATERLLGDVPGMSKSMADASWIPPLYYTAIKCRVHRLRLHAIRLIEAASHREGIWDGVGLASVARKVMEMEERGFYGDTSAVDNFHNGSYPDATDFTLPALPNAYRMHEVRVLLPDSPRENTVLLCRRKQEDGSWTVVVNEFDASSQSWLENHEDITEVGL